uniref:Small integral membrane protein 15 n=1 Tax=Strigamia maritima TaxID=126957 RepID=T1J4I4_STRMM
MEFRTRAPPSLFPLVYQALLAIYLRVGGQPRDVVLSPFFLISAVLSWKLAKHIEQQEKDKNKKEKKESNIAKIRKAKSD